MIMQISEKDIRRNIKKRACRIFSNYKDSTALIEELDLQRGESRIDMAFISNVTIGIEIKSPKDNLSRLTKQSLIYSKYFDYVILVIDSKFFDQAKDIIPNWWGLVSVSLVKGRVSCKLLKRPTLNPNVEIEALLELLWKNELLEILEKHTNYKSKKSFTRADLRQLIVKDSIHYSDLKKECLEIMLGRKTWRSSLVSDLDC